MDRTHDIALCEIARCHEGDFVAAIRGISRRRCLSSDYLPKLGNRSPILSNLPDRLACRVEQQCGATTPGVEVRRGGVQPGEVVVEETDDATLLVEGWDWDRHRANDRDVQAGTGGSGRLETGARGARHQVQPKKLWLEATVGLDYGDRS
jgi:hypothetical protein